jgi:endoglucanase
MDSKAMKLLENLCNCSGSSGLEREPILLMKEYAAPYSDKIDSDMLGNMFFERVGDKTGPTVLIPARVDEIGFIITAI